MDIILAPALEPSVLVGIQSKLMHILTGHEGLGRNEAVNPHQMPGETNEIYYVFQTHVSRQGNGLES